MREIRYKTFSLRTHQKNWQLNRPNLCQFEITFRCGFHCRHCYTDCYNKPVYFKKELNTREVIYILDKVQQAGVIWLCFTGGDPLVRKDFLKIYSYAKKKGFLITLFTNGYSLNKRILEFLKAHPPFVVEITLNAVTKELFERITQRKGSFVKVMESIRCLLKEKIPLKIKTQVTKDNIEELPRIKRFVKDLGLPFLPSFILYPGLNGNRAPCKLRVSKEEIFSLDQEKIKEDSPCGEKISGKEKSETSRTLFPCTIDSKDGFYLDPYGNVSPCYLIRQLRLNLLQVSVEEVLKKILSWVSKQQSLDSLCRSCNLRQFCAWCPGKSYLEYGNLTTPIPYYCELAKLAKDKYA